MPAGKLMLVAPAKKGAKTSKVKRVYKKAKKQGLTKNEKSAIKKLVSEDIAVKDVYNDQITLNNTWTLVPASPTGNAFFSLSNTSQVVSGLARPADRNGDSIRALNMDLRIHTVFPGQPTNMKVRYLLIQWQDVDGANIDQVFNNTYANTQPYLVIDGNRVRNPDVKYKILADKTVNYTPNYNGSNAITKHTRIVHKFKDSESRMDYVPGYNLGTGPQTGTVQLFACFAYPRMNDGSTYTPTSAPHISLSCRQRYMK